MRSEWQNSFLSLILILSSITGKAQVSGYVFDYETKEPLVSCNIINNESKKGSSTDINGKFILDALIGSKISISFVGYQTKEYIIQKKEIGIIYLNKIAREIQEIKIINTEDPAINIIKKVISNKKYKEKTLTYRKELLQIYLGYTGKTINPLNKSKLYRKYSDSLNNKVPFYISQEIFKNNILEKENSYGISIQKDFFKDYINELDVEYNIEDEKINIFGRSIISPLSQNALSYHQYFLHDSLILNNEYCYKIKVKSKKNSNATFEGFLWVNASSFQLQKAELSLNTNHINYIRNLSIIQEYNNKEANRVQINKDMEFLLDFSDLYLQDSVFFISKNISWRQENKIDEDVLFNNNKSIIKTLNNDSHINFVTKLSETLITSYYTKNIFDIGPIYHMHSRNKVEGQKILLIARTNKKLFSNILLTGYLGRGFKDQRMKYGYNLKIRNKQSNGITLSIGKRSDTEYIGGSFINDFLYPNNFNNLSESFLSSIFRKSNQYEMVYYNKQGLSIKKEFNKLDITLNYFKKSIEDNESLFINNNLNIMRSFGFQIRYSKNQKVKNHFDVFFVKSHLPIFFSDFKITKHNSSSVYIFSYKLGVLQTINTASLGRTKYLLDIGLISNNNQSIHNLEIHRGNSSYIYDFSKSSLMNKYEFISDNYFASYIEQHLNGRILNRLPLIKTLDLREVLFTNIIVGNLRKKSILDHTNNFITPLKYSEPYMEVGFGLENIFKIFRVNLVWRLTHLNENTASFGIFWGINLSL